MDGRAREARGQPRRRRRHEAPARRGLRRRPAEGAARRARGAAARPARDRARRHELRPGRGRLRHPRERRRDPLVLRSSSASIADGIEAGQDEGHRGGAERGRARRDAGRRETTAAPEGVEEADAPPPSPWPTARGGCRRGAETAARPSRSRPETGSDRRHRDQRSARQGAPRPDRRRDDGLQARAARRRAATSRRPGRSCARRAWPSAGKRADRATTEGLVGVIVDGGVGVDRRRRLRDRARLEERRVPGVRREGARARCTPTAPPPPRRSRRSASSSSPSSARTSSSPAPTRFEARRRVAAYVHPPANKIGVLVQLEGGSRGARAPASRCTSRSRRPSTRPGTTFRPRWSRPSAQIYLNSDEVQSKPEQAREKIVDGMLAKRFFAAAPGGVLLDQAWIHDAAKTVGAGARRGGGERHGVRAGLGRGVVTVRPEELEERAREGRSARSAASCSSSRARPDGGQRVRHRPADASRRSRARCSRSTTRGRRSPSSSGAETSTAA